MSVPGGSFIPFLNSLNHLYKKVSSGDPINNTPVINDQLLDGDFDGMVYSNLTLKLDPKCYWISKGNFQTYHKKIDKRFPYKPYEKERCQIITKSKKICFMLGYEFFYIFPKVQTTYNLYCLRGKYCTISFEDSYEISMKPPINLSILPYKVDWNKLIQPSISSYGKIGSTLSLKTQFVSKIPIRPRLQLWYQYVGWYVKGIVVVFNEHDHILSLKYLDIIFPILLNNQTVSTIFGYDYVKNFIKS